MLDPFGPARGRSKPERVVQLAAMALPTAEKALAALLDADASGTYLDQFERAWNLTPDEARTLYETQQIRMIAGAEGVLGLALHRWTALCDRICGALQDWHAEQPESLGPTAPALAAKLGLPIRSAIMHAAIKFLIEERRVVREGLGLRKPDLRMIPKSCLRDWTPNSFNRQLVPGCRIRSTRSLPHCMTADGTRIRWSFSISRWDMRTLSSSHGSNMR